MKKKLTHFAFGLHQMVERIEDALESPNREIGEEFFAWAKDQNLKEDLRSLNHYIAEAAPIIEDFPFKKEPAIEFIYLLPKKLRIPLRLQVVLMQDYERGKYKDYTSLHISEPTLLIKNDKRAILSTIKRMEQIAGWVMKDYDDGKNRIWETLGLGGDDSVDYAGGYVFAICSCLRAWAYREYNDSKFLK